MDDSAPGGVPTRVGRGQFATGEHTLRDRRRRAGDRRHSTPLPVSELLGHRHLERVGGVRTRVTRFQNAADCVAINNAITADPPTRRLFCSALGFTTDDPRYRSSNGLLPVNDVGLGQVEDRRILGLGQPLP
jgi:hypothetical protein